MLAAIRGRLLPGGRFFILMTLSIDLASFALQPRAGQVSVGYMTMPLERKKDAAACKPQSRAKKEEGGFVRARALRIIAVGRIRTSWWKEACDYYVKMISRWQKIEIVETRDSEASLPVKERISQEGERLLEKLLPGEFAIALGENGRGMTSPAFAEFLERLGYSAKKPAFIIGGPFGLSEKVLQRSGVILSLSPMTFPHELARTLLLEQIFRASCIRNNFPYHH